MIEKTPPKTTSESQRRLELRVQPPEHLGQLAVARHRVGDPRGADHAGVGGDEEDRRREDPDVDLRDGEDGAVQAEVLDEAEHRVVLEAARRRLAELRHVVRRRGSTHRQRRERDQRQREVDREDGDRDQTRSSFGIVRTRVARLLGEVRDGLDPRVGDHPDRDREQEALQLGALPKWTLCTSTCGLKIRKKPRQTSSSWVAKSTTASRTLRLAASLTPTMLTPTSSHVKAMPTDDVPRVRPQRRPEDREVVRHEDRRDGDRDHVVQHLGPGGPERDELVERVPGEARRAAGLREADGSLGVGGGRRREDQPADDEDERGQPERDPGDDAERVVDRRADVPVGGRKERGRAEHALQVVSLSPPRHEARIVVRARASGPWTACPTSVTLV